MENNKNRRYLLVRCAKNNLEFFNDEQSMAKRIRDLRKLNGVRNSQYFYGQFKCEKYGVDFLLSYQTFFKLTGPMFLDDIDKMTTQYENSLEIRRKYNVSDNSSIRIALRNNGDITLLPIFYASDKKYLDQEYLKHAIISRCVGIDFIYELYRDEYIYRSKKAEADAALNELMATKEKVKCGYLPTYMLIAPSYNFYRSFCRKRDGSPDYRAKRYLAELIRRKEELEMSEQERLESLMSGENYQYTLWDYMKHKTTN